MLYPLGRIREELESNQRVRSKNKSDCNSSSSNILFAKQPFITRTQVTKLSFGRISFINFVLFHFTFFYIQSLCQTIQLHEFQCKYLEYRVFIVYCQHFTSVKLSSSASELQMQRVTVYEAYFLFSFILCIVKQEHCIYVRLNFLILKKNQFVMVKQSILYMVRDWDPTFFKNLIK